jgi:hypothetical protein
VRPTEPKVTLLSSFQIALPDCHPLVRKIFKNWQERVFGESRYLIIKTTVSLTLLQSQKLRVFLLLPQCDLRYESLRKTTNSID